MSDIKIGDTFWARGFGGSWTERDKFTRVTVKDETKVSWIVGEPNFDYSDIKVPKNNPYGLDKTKPERPRLYTDEHKAGVAYMAKHRHHIARGVESLRDARLLEQIATLIGYKETDNG